MQRCGFEIAIESNGTIATHPAIDWICISPKAGSDVVQRQGHELKLVWPQTGSDIVALEAWKFDHFLLQPMDSGNNITNEANRNAAIQQAMLRPKWKISLQNHKLLGLP
jgi:7-carboxy-7-deazaguanine synthase